MKIFNIIIGLFLLISNFAYSQDSRIGQFAIWKAKEGMSQKFETGYKKHLEWHKTHNDPWDWYGWYIISGERYGQFVDATFNHAWSDFDNAVDPSGDLADNMLHVFPFADVQTVFKVSNHPNLGFNKGNKFNSRILKLITIELTDITNGLKTIEKVVKYYEAKNLSLFQTFELIDGGNSCSLIVIVGFDNWKSYGAIEDLTYKIFEMEKSLNYKHIVNITSETMVYREDLSLYSKD